MGGKGLGNGFACSVGFKGAGKGKHNLHKINWDGVVLDRVNKDFLHESPEVQSRSEEECDRWRMEYGIQVSENGLFDDHPSNVPKPVIDFAELPFRDFIMESIRETSSFLAPYPIQAQVWPAALKGRDIVGIAETGSGKTLCYALPMLMHVLGQPEIAPGEGPIALVFVPTRELSIQIKETTDRVALYGPQVRLHSVAIYGGQQNWQAQTEELMSGDAEICIATPGRLIDMLNFPVTNLRRATFIVVDEADELLAGGFEKQIELILTQSREDKQTLLFSATWPENVKQLAAKACGLENAILYVCQGTTKLSACRNIAQRFQPSLDMNSVSGSNPDPAELIRSKLDKLSLAIRAANPDEMMRQNTRCLVFCNRKEDVRRVTCFLQSEGFPANGMLSDIPQGQRDEILRNFRETQEAPILVSTDLLGRGYDFPDVAYVVNFDMPKRVVQYIHRIGRTARAGKWGTSLTFIDPDFFDQLKTPIALREVLKESGQKVPKWLDHGINVARWAGNRERRQRWENLKNGRHPEDHQHSSSSGESTSSEAIDREVTQEHVWQGRGSIAFGCKLRYQELLARSVTARFIGVTSAQQQPAPWM